MDNDLKEMYGIDEENPELSGEESLNPQNELSDIYPLENINVVQAYFSIFELKRKYDRTKKQNADSLYSDDNRKNQIILDSEFQREKVWDRKQESELIESVLMGLPIPVMYLFEDKSANLIVVDGRQRLTAFFEFLDNEFILTGLKILKALNGLKFDDIDPVYQSKLEDYQLISQVIKPPTPDSIKFQMFDRVNRGGTTLNNQEMRNALYQGNATKLLKRLTENELFKEVTQNGLKPKRMKDKYVVLRALAFYLYFDEQLIDSNKNKIEYKGDMDDFLGKTMAYLNSISQKRLNEIEEVFFKSLNKCKDVLGEDLFRLKKADNQKKSPINMNIFEVTIYIMIKLGHSEGLNKSIYDSYYRLLKSAVFLNNIGDHRDSKTKYHERYSIICNEFKEVIKYD
ncbi:DUF262 domain-containing protein [Clostridium butyricum]